MNLAFLEEGDRDPGEVSQERFSGQNKQMSLSLINNPSSTKGFGTDTKHQGRVEMDHPRYLNNHTCYKPETLRGAGNIFLTAFFVSMATTQLPSAFLPFVDKTALRQLIFKCVKNLQYQGKIAKLGEMIALFLLIP